MLIKFTSVERILEFVKLPREPLYEGKIKPDLDWPQRGQIDFKHVTLRYDDSQPDIIRNLSIMINPGEKIGIIGRSEAGKSSFIQTLFRLYEAYGTIMIDNVNIKDLSLHELRSKLTIISVLVLFGF